ncbi:hypothetical protein [Enterococcus sp. HY326]|uniref:hypothetical protein n=1 Tax=Enterococcus sp. HY326 TaxID=2971265 RepID=UPI002240BE7A|nr:hypothetical protein [Enterococcus sp. HY326]
MKETKKIYFIEQTKSIEGSYIEIDTVSVAETEADAVMEFEKLASGDCEKSFGYTLNEYEISAEPTFFQRLIASWKKLPADFYRKMQIITFRPIMEFQA